MCFSASASFGAGVVLNVIGVASIKKAQHSTHLPFASYSTDFWGAANIGGYTVAYCLVTFNVEAKIVGHHIAYLQDYPAAFRTMVRKHESSRILKDESCLRTIDENIVKKKPPKTSTAKSLMIVLSLFIQHKIKILQSLKQAHKPHSPNFAMCPMCLLC